MSPCSRDRTVDSCPGGADASVASGWTGQRPAQGRGELEGAPSPLEAPRGSAAGSRRPA